LNADGIQVLILKEYEEEKNGLGKSCDERLEWSITSTDIRGSCEGKVESDQTKQNING
jgi:hypothetical protein